MASTEENPRNEQQPPSFEVVHGTPIVFTEEEISTLDETFGVPQRVAKAVSEQMRTALDERNLRTEEVRFSGYFDARDTKHSEKAAGEFAGKEGVHLYCFAAFDALEDGAEGPVAYAATGGMPGIGAYSHDQLLAIGYDNIHEMAHTTPAALIGALLFEFRPNYVIDV